MCTATKPLKLNLSNLDEKMKLAVAELRKSYQLIRSKDGIPVTFNKAKSSEISASFRNGIYEIEADTAPHFYFALSMLLLKSQTLEDSKGLSENFSFWTASLDLNAMLKTQSLMYKELIFNSRGCRNSNQLLRHPLAY